MVGARRSSRDALFGRRSVRIMGIEACSHRTGARLELDSQFNRILGLAGRRTERALNEDQKRFVQRIRMDSAHLLKSINEILDLSKIRRGEFVEVAVSDNGIGIAAEEHQSIFDKFHQVSQVTRRVREGTGLGLAITKTLVEQHGGRIWLESEPGKGSRFTFTIPAEASAGMAAGCA